MTKIQSTCIRALAACAIAAMPLSALADTSTPQLRIANNEPGTISLSSQSPGLCGAWTGTGVVLPPTGVGSGATTAPFELSVSGTCASVNQATMTYTFAHGGSVTHCTYQITGNSPFSYSASGAAGCTYAIDAMNGNITFIYPNTTLSIHPHSVRR